MPNNSSEHFCKMFKSFVQFSKGVPTAAQWEDIKEALEKVDIPEEKSLFDIISDPELYSSLGDKLKDTKKKIEDHLKDDSER